MQSLLICYVLAARKLGMDLDPDRILTEYKISVQEITPLFVVQMAVENGLQATEKKLAWRHLRKGQQVFPAILILDNREAVLLLGFKNQDNEQKAVILDPLTIQSELTYLTQEELKARWQGKTILLQKKTAKSEENVAFGVPWFLHQLKQNRGLFTQVSILSVVLNLMALILPIFTMLVLDKVVSTQGYETLHVLFFGVSVALIFNSILSFLRSELLLYMTSQLDIRLARFSLNRLASMPAQLFQKFSAGVLGKHMQQVDRVRDFFAGNLLLTILDSLAILIFIPILYLQSPLLTLIVLSFTVLICLNVILTASPYKNNLEHLYHNEAAKQGILMEFLHGVETVKTLGLSRQIELDWLERSAAVARAQFQVGRVNTITSEIGGFLQKIMSASLIWVGAQLVLDNTMSVGGLIAFNMLSGRITGPIVQLVKIVHKFQEMSISIKVMGAVLNRPTEKIREQGISATIHGGIKFENVTFRYTSDTPAILKEINFEIFPEEKVGVVGRSGSGKSTLANLLNALYYTKQGVVRIDGYDIREFDIVYLRSHLSVVSQQPFLFRSTVRENIAKVNGSATLEDVIRSAQMAGASEFIEKLPKGYDTMLDEGAKNLSGGQQQRLALARALLADPRILILDEATSALDPDSETIVRENLPRFAMGRTVLNISHRLNTLVDMDRIIVLDEGEIVSFGTHEQLLKECSLYAHMWYLQNPHLLPSNVGKQVEDQRIEPVQFGPSAKAEVVCQRSDASETSAQRLLTTDTSPEQQALEKKTKKKSHYSPHSLYIPNE
ncbi:peptidase domain-containing ABC transporter [Magnetococcales bacterium HHB-1]